jgi:Zn-finger nucleic acid-binding protein
MFKCPKCNHELRPANRQGVEIDVCPTCRGVWLDRGELDKIISRASRDFDDDWDDDRRGRPRSQEQPRKKSFWQELFD